MGIVNLTPDSFSDGGRYADEARAIAHAHSLLGEGADILDLGAESTRPGAAPVRLESELARLMPVLAGLRGFPIPISIDTYKPEVMREAIRLGAAMINDINALRTPGSLDVVAQSDAGVCLMHMQGTPQTMQQDPRYGDVVAEVRQFLADRVAALEDAGIGRERIVLDPGFGFGKTKEHNVALLRGLDELSELGLPVLAGLSRKSVLARLVQGEIRMPSPQPDGDDRVHASIAAALFAVCKGARIVRVHDVKATCDALAIYNAVMAEPPPDA
ncbi:MAG: dihydropteroate synthase [Burkholderiales bacterium]